jgi:anti-anti-sigma factor
MDEPRIHTDRMYGGSVPIVVLEGEHDVGTRQAVLDEVGRAFAAAPAIVVDLSKATFIDSSVLSVLAYAHWRPGTTLALVAPRPGTVAARMLGMTGAAAVFSLFPTRDEAVDWCRLAGAAAGAR